MNTRILSLITGVLLVLCTGSAIAQDFPGVNVNLTIANGKGRTQNVVVGINEAATTGLDALLGEIELPPLPPVEIFDARIVSTPGKSQLGTGSWTDLRPVTNATANFSHVYTLSYQAGEGASSVTLSWDNPLASRVVKLAIDGVDMAGKTSLVVNGASGLVSVEVTFNYRPLIFSANPGSLTFNANNVSPTPPQTVDIVPENQTDAQWMLTPDVPWLDVSMNSGSGRQTVEVSLNTSVLPAGAYSANLQVRSPMYDIRFNIPVTLNMVVGVDRTPVPTDPVILTNHPNPFNPSTVLEVRLPVTDMRSQPMLKVYDANGREVADLSAALTAAVGVQRVVFDATGLAGGVYTARLRAGATDVTRSLVLIK